MKYEHLFSKGKIGSLEVKNKVVMPAIGIGLSRGTFVTDETIAYYEERAKGGVGLIIIEATRTNDDTGAANPNQTSLTTDEHIAGLTRLTGAVHRHGAKIFAQLYHPGNQRSFNQARY